MKVRYSVCIASLFLVLASCSNRDATPEAIPSTMPKADLENRDSATQSLVNPEASPSTGTPVLILHETFGNARGSQTQEYDLAFWQDGYVLRWRCRDFSVLSVESAVANKGMIAELMERVETAGFFDLQAKIWTPPDAGYWEIGARYGGRMNFVGWDEVKNPNYGANIRPTAEYKKLQRTWKSIRKAIRDSLPMVWTPVVDDAGLRGLNRSEVFQTAWLRFETWKNR
ncbi:MAG TPA: hypothetical protein VJZ71_08470 [Phycisphaerae bacterium]|nr:hypothetical protein [Phycisphaerae bacterium]